MRLTDPVARIDLGAIVRNAARLRHRANNRPLLAAVKADGYGHGAVTVARALEQSGVVNWFGVATAKEALQLRNAGIGGRILVFGPVPGTAEAIRPLLANGVDLTVTDQGDVAQITQAVEMEREQQRDNGENESELPLARVHLKTDTGMGRVGRPWKQAAELAPRLAENDALDFVGVWTHLAVADEAQQDDFTHRQLNAFDSLLAELDRQGCRPPIAHAANSAGLVRFPESHYDMVRAGIALYGYMASVEGRQQAAIEAKVKLEPALQLAAPVTFVKRVTAGTPISYGATWRAQQPTWIATVRTGYADGYPRALSGRAAATVGDRPARIAGRVCMDQMMLAVDTPEDEPPAVGEEAVLIGPGGEGQAPAADVLAEACDTIAYELLVRVSARVTRQYVNATPADALAT